MAQIKKENILDLDGTIEFSVTNNNQHNLKTTVSYQKVYKNWIKFRVISEGNATLN